MKYLFSALLVFVSCSGRPPTPVGDPIVELDHVFVLVPASGAEAREALRESGIELTTEAIRHDGQGTASVSAGFANAYLELLWVDSSVTLAPAHRESHERSRRGTGWRGSDPSPFGIGLRRTPSGPDVLPFDSRPHTAAWMTPGTQIDVLAPLQVGHASPRVFVVPRDMGFHAFREEVRRDTPELFVHRFAERQLTAVRIVTPPSARVEFVSDMGSLPGISFRDGPEHLAELVFDDHGTRFSATGAVGVE